MRILHPTQTLNQGEIDPASTDPSHWTMKYREGLTDNNHQTLMLEEAVLGVSNWTGGAQQCTMVRHHSGQNELVKKLLQ